MPLPNVSVEKVSEYTGHKGSVFALVVDAAQKFAYTSGDDGMVACWDLKGLEDWGKGVLQTGQAIYALALAEAYDLLIAGSSDGTLYFVNTETYTLIHTFRKTTGAIYGLHYEAERSLLWVLHAGGALSVLSIPDFVEKGYQRIGQDHLRALTATPDGKYWLIGSSDQNIYVFDRIKGGVVKQWKAHESSVFTLAVHPHKPILLSGGRDAYLRTWNMKEGFAPLEAIPAHNFTLNHIAFTPTGNHFITASRDKTIKVWDAHAFKLLKVIDLLRNKGHKHSVNRLSWLSQDNSLLSCSDDRRLIRWKINVAPSLSGV